MEQETHASSSSSSTIGEPGKALPFVAERKLPRSRDKFCIAEARHAYKSQAQIEHGTVINPITGEEVDIMQQCVNLQLDTGSQHEVGDMDAYQEVVADFSEELKQGTIAWVCLSDGRFQKGAINRVNAEDRNAVTYDFQYMKTVIEGNKKTDKIFIIKDLTRMQLKTRQVLVRGDPAGGKTTFAKQLLTWIMREESMKRLVPVMVRTIDLIRYQGELLNDGRDIIDQYLQLHYEDTGFYSLFLQARVEGRLLIILDGFDEVGALERRLTDEIKDQLVNECFLVLTSRDMGTTFEAPAFERFRSVRVKELNSDQQRQVIQRRLSGDDQVSAFCKQLTLNPALNAMAKNPLLLNVTLAVFESSGFDGGEGLNRGKVYSVALDGMLCSLEKNKAADSPKSRASNPTFSAQALRSVLRRMAFMAHSFRHGQGIRDFGIDLIKEAIETSGVGDDFTLAHWKNIEDIVKRGRLPVLAWFYEEGADTFRFAHLTFQEFLCAEQCLQESLRDDNFLNFWKDLVCSTGPMELVRRGWWQQTLQMYCDLAVSSGAKSQTGLNLSTALGESFLDLGEDSDRCLQMPQNIDDSNILTVVSMLHMNSVVEQISFGRKLSCHGISTLQTLKLSALQLLSLRGNHIGPDGCRSIANFLQQSGGPLQELDLSNNILCQGDPKENMPPKSECNPSTGHYDSHETDLSGFGLLLDAIRTHPTLKAIDFRGNFLTLEAGKMLTDLVSDNPDLQKVCGIPIDQIYEQKLPSLEFSNRGFFLQRNGAAEPFMSTGDAELLMNLLLKFPQPDLSSLRLSNQALASDKNGVVELFGKIGDVVAAATQITKLDLEGFWDCGVEAGIALGRKIKSHPCLPTICIGTGKIDLEEIRRIGKQDSTGHELNLSSRNSSGIRDCGAGILSECLPLNISKLNLRGLGVGASGYKVLSGCSQLAEIDGIRMKEFTDECSVLDLSANPTQSSGAVACVIARSMMTPKLKHLDLSDSNLTSKSHVHILTPVIGGGGGIGCDGGCDCSSFRGTNAFKKCSRCDLDFCSTCCMSECPMVALADALGRLPELTSLKIANCAFQGGRNGPVRSHRDIESYRVLGVALSRHATLTELDISKNYFKGPGFPYLARGVALMPELSSLKVGNHIIEFKTWLTSERIEGDEDWIEAEVLVLARAVVRNRTLQHLDLSPCSARLTQSIANAFVESLQGISDTSLFTPVEPILATNEMREADPNARQSSAVRSVSSNGVNIDTVCIRRDVTLPFGELRRGDKTTLDFGCDSVRSEYSNLASLFALMIRVGTNLEEIDFTGLLFEDVEAEKALVDAVLVLAKEGKLQKYNGFPSCPSRTLEELNLERRPIMSHGICVLASSTLQYGNITSLNVSGCGMNAPSLATLLSGLLLKQTVVSLDVSYQSLQVQGALELGKFLRLDKKLQVLRARGINLSSRPTDHHHMTEFAKALDTNVTLASLDLRENTFHESIVDRLRRTMEEKRRVVPCPLEVKYYFLLWNSRRPQRLRLPNVMCNEVSALFADGAQSPIALIFQYCALARQLLLDGDEDEDGLNDNPRVPIEAGHPQHHLADDSGEEWTDSDIDE